MDSRKGSVAVDALRSGIADLLRSGGRRPGAAGPGPDRAGRVGRRSARQTIRELRSGDGSAVLDGAEERELGGNRVCVIRREVEELLPESPLHRELQSGLEALASRDPEEIYPGLRPAIGCTTRDLVILDLETTGFWGCPVFLAGMLLEEDGRLVSVQILARDYPEEPAMLAAASSVLEQRKVLVTFNGKSYDAPCFAERCAAHRVDTSIARMPHVDILHAARRRWKKELADCRLQTLEWEVVGLHRTGDVPSAEIPERYHAFAATGDPEELSGVLHHGRVDVVTTASLLARLLEDPPAPLRPRRRGPAPAPSG